MTYNDALQAMNITEPPRLRQLTDALEALMAADIRQGRPCLSARVVSRGTQMPAAGFFETARALGVTVLDEAGYHAQTLVLLDQGPPERR